MRRHPAPTYPVSGYAVPTSLLNPAPDNGVAAATTRGPKYHGFALRRAAVRRANAKVPAIAVVSIAAQITKT